MRIPFALQSYQSRALPFSAQRVVNYFAEKGPGGAKNEAILYNAPGIKAFGNASLAGAVRGFQVMAGVLYAVAGNTLYSISSTGAATNLGTVDSHVHPISMAVNRASPQELAIADGAGGWTYDTSNGLVKITDADFGTPDTVAFQDGYFIWNDTGTARFFISDLDDGQAYAATDFAEAESDPSEVLAVISNHQQIWAFKGEKIEVWFNSGNADFPFQRIEGGVIERGCAARFSIAADDNTLFWLGNDYIVYRAAGLTPQRVSTHAIEEILREMSDVSDAFAFFVTISGHKFYVISFPTGGRSFALDLSTMLWHERESFGARYWRASAYAFCYGKHLVGDAFQGRIGELDMDTFTEFGETMQGIITSPPVHGDRKNLFHHRLELDLESGVGTTAGGTPQLWIDWSDDGGRTFSAQKPFRSMGPIGQYRQKVYVNRLGSSEERIYRVTVADAVKRSLIAAHLDASAGTV